LNPATGVISPQYHAVLDWFATISVTNDELPDFNRKTWQKMFGDSTYQYFHYHDSDLEDEIDTTSADQMERV
jgi:uncharacterized protein YjlB